jgi:hypothetical protein
MRKVIIICGIVILVAAAAFVGIKYFPIKQEKPVIQTFSTKQNPAFKAVPQKCPLIVEVKDQEGFFKALKGDNPLFAELRGIPEFEGLFSNISRFRDFVGSHSGIGNLLKSKSIIVSINPSGKNQLANLFLVQLNDQNESGSAVEVVSRELGSEYTITRKSYDNTTIINAKSPELNFYFACANDIFMISEDFILVEEALRQSSSVNLLSNNQFTEVYKTIEETALANIFINHQNISQVISKFVAPEIRKNLSQIASYSNWSELDLSAKSTELEFNGYSVSRDSSDNYLNVFHNQEAQKLTIEKAIPTSSSYFVALNLKNTGLFIDQYEVYLRTKGNYYPREMNLLEFKKKTNTDGERLIKDIVGNQVAGVYTNINKSNPFQNRFFVAEVINNSEAKEKLVKAVAEYGKVGKPGEEKMLTEYAVGSKKSFNIYRLPIANMAESLFGRAFSGINAQYFALYEKYLICGDNLPGMKSYLQNLASGKTLANDSIYLANSKESQPKPNFYLYSRIPKVFRLKDVLFKPEVSTMLSSNENIIRKFSTFSWQFSVSDKMIKNRIALKYDPNFKEEPQAIWQLKLDGKLATKPLLVLNHKDLPNREVIVCDNQNNLSLINKEGLVLWTINIPGEIMSEIHQIDIYRTNRFQYVFNTKTQLYVIDRMGNNVGKYPITLKSIASNGVCIAEYGQNKEFRFIIAGEDKNVYVFDRDGKLVPQWNFKGTESLVTSPVQHFDLDGKDYLIISDQQNIYFLDRQGKTREGQPAPFDRSASPVYFINEGNPRLISTDRVGRIHIMDFAGQAEIKEMGKFGTAHRFVAEDLDGNGSPEYIFADGKKLTILSADGKKLGEHTFPDVISESPFVCTMGAGITKIGVVIKGENKVYLLDKSGSVMRGLPLEGDTNFILGKFNDSNAWVNLIVGAQGNMLVNYRIE